MTTGENIKQPAVAGSIHSVVGEQRAKALSDWRQLVAYEMTIPGWNAAARSVTRRMIKEKREAFHALLSNSD